MTESLQMYLYFTEMVLNVCLNVRATSWCNKLVQLQGITARSSCLWYEVELAKLCSSDLEFFGFVFLLLWSFFS